MSFQTTPTANRLHIGIFGKVNSGKSTFMNGFTGQAVSLVSDVPGTTTDVVKKAMEVAPLGPCVFWDTAGFDDPTELGERRKALTLETMEKCDMAVLIIADRGTLKNSKADLTEEKECFNLLQSKQIPVVVICNQMQETPDTQLLQTIREFTKDEVLVVNAESGAGMEHVRETLARKMPKDFELPFITGDLVQESDVVMLVMPQDAQAPKGRLILPQVQTIRELLDRKCITVAVTLEKMPTALAAMKRPPKLIVTDSQVFPAVYELKPKESMLTSFSVLFAAYKGDLPYYMEGAAAIDSLTEHARVLIAECCTHAPLTEDIGRVKIPAMLKKRFGQGLQTEVVSGTDFPADLSSYDLIIQCGGCMFNRRYILSRVDRAKMQQVPMTNYGVAIAHLTGILDKISM